MSRFAVMTLTDAAVERVQVPIESRGRVAHDPRGLVGGRAELGHSPSTFTNAKPGTARLPPSTNRGVPE